MKKYILAMITFIIVNGWAVDVEWTRLRGTVKAINLKSSSLTIQNGDGDLISVPIDYQVKILEKRGDITTLGRLQLDQKVMLIRIPIEKPKEELEGLVPPELEKHGR